MSIKIYSQKKSVSSTSQIRGKNLQGEGEGEGVIQMDKKYNCHLLHK